MGHNKPIGKGQRGPMQAIRSAGALLGAEYMGPRRFAAEKSQRYQWAYA